MDVNDHSEVDKKNDETRSYHSPNLSSVWQHNGANVANSSSMGLIIPNRNNHPMSVCGDVAVGALSSSGSMTDSFCPTVWEHLVNNPSGLNEVNLSNDTTASDPLSMLKASLFLPNISEILPPSLSQFPADSAFIERAARFSSFNGGHYGDVLSPYVVHQPGNPFVRGGPLMHNSLQEVLPGNPVSSNHSRETERNLLGETSKNVSLPQDHEGLERSPTHNVAKVKRSREESKQGVSMSGNASDEAGFSGSGPQEDGPPSFGKGFGSKKGKWGNQDTEQGQTNEAQQKSGEGGKIENQNQQKGECGSTPHTNKSNGKNGKQSSQASDPAKEDYIHVRARRGQATNSHSLAERVRREKISERMKFLQDLVPGCSKVTGKAVMLDEIINYVQSLQRQVEFLSMKLSTVNPRLDFDIERLLAKDQMFSVRAGPSAGLGFSPDMPMAYPPLHRAPHSMMQPALPEIVHSSDALRRTVTSQVTNLGGGYKEPPQPLPNNAWEGELHNVVQMGFNATTPLENQETNCSLPSGQMKAEP